MKLEKEISNWKIKLFCKQGFNAKKRYFKNQIVDWFKRMSGAFEIQINDNNLANFALILFQCEGKMDSIDWSAEWDLNNQYKEFSRN